MIRDDEAKKLQDLKAKIQRANEGIAAGNSVDGKTFFQGLLESEGVNPANVKPGNVQVSLKRSC
ncbi:hypothetical protein [Phytobacter sp. AG2a]